MLIETLATFLALSLIIALRYLLVAGAAFVLVRSGAAAPEARGRIRPRPAPPDGAAVRREIMLSLASSPIYAAPAALALGAWRHGAGELYLDPLARGVLWLPISVLIYVLAQDAYYYWLHRALHRPALFALAHRGHHLSRAPTPFASFAFDPLEAALSAWFLPALTFIIPLNLWAALFLLTLMTAAAVLNHAGVEVWPQAWLARPVGRWAITATHHDLHHRRQGCNFGLYFRLWDRLMGTDREEAAIAGPAAMEPAAASRPVAPLI